jgi:hypothetical protein
MRHDYFETFPIALTLHMTLELSLEWGALCPSPDHWIFCSQKCVPNFIETFGKQFIPDFYSC